MSESTLSNSLMIKLEGPKLQEFDPVRAINHWFNLVPRRPGTSGSTDNKKGRAY